MDLEALLADVDLRLQQAVQSFWDTREEQGAKQAQSDRPDAGNRREVTGGAQMNALEGLIAEKVELLGLPDLVIQRSRPRRTPRVSGKNPLELPGYYRPEKKWDMVILSKGRLVAAIELKSQVGPSFGNNANNRAEEAIGTGEDIWKAVREHRFGEAALQPFVGYIFLLEDCPDVHASVGLQQPFFRADPVFVKQALLPPLLGRDHSGVSYAERYEILCRRLKMDKLYSATCFFLASKGKPAKVTMPAPDLTFRVFLATLIAHASVFAVA